jgi:hypothetical protein
LELLALQLPEPILLLEAVERFTLTQQIHLQLIEVARFRLVALTLELAKPFLDRLLVEKKPQPILTSLAIFSSALPEV